METLRVFTSFSGYDSQCLALKRLGIMYEIVGWSEIDKHAIKAHDILFPEYADRNYGDISKIDWSAVPDFDLLTYSSPCQDFSQAGKKKGGEQGSGTRSSLLWECKKAIEIKRPKYCLMENVSALVTEKFIKLFNEWQTTLYRLGYVNFCKVLNAKDFGVPQNRERIFLISIREDVAFKFNFPKEIRLEKRLKDVLEDDVDERYYLSDAVIQSHIANCEKMKDNGNGFTFEPTEGDCVGKAVTTKAGGRMTDNFILARPHGYYDGGIYGDVAPCVKSSAYAEHNPLVEKDNYLQCGYRIRKLTPRECLRLMDVDDSDIDKLIEGGISNSQLYKLAGNSIVVAVLEQIFRKMFVDRSQEKEQLEIDFFSKRP